MEIILQEERILSVRSEHLPGFVISDWISFFFTWITMCIFRWSLLVTSVRVSMIPRLGLSMQPVCGTFCNMILWVSLFISSGDMTYRSTKQVSLVFSQSYNWNLDFCDMSCFKTVEVLKIPMASYCHNESFIWERLAQTQRYSLQGHWELFSFGTHFQDLSVSLVPQMFTRLAHCSLKTHKLIGGRNCPQALATSLPNITT